MFADTLQVIMNVISADVEPYLHHPPYYALFFFLGCFAGLLVFEFSYAWLDVWVDLPELFTLGRWEIWLGLGNRWVRYHFHWYRLKADFVVCSVDSLSCHLSTSICQCAISPTQHNPRYDSYSTNSSAYSRTSIDQSSMESSAERSSVFFSGSSSWTAMPNSYSNSRFRTQPILYPTKYYTFPSRFWITNHSWLCDWTSNFSGEPEGTVAGKEKWTGGLMYGPAVLMSEV
jgi:hypothetical protein